MKLILALIIVYFMISCETKSSLKDLKTIKNSELNFEKSKTPNFSINCFFDKLSNQFNVFLDVNQVNEDDFNIFLKIGDKNSENTIDSIHIQTKWLIIPPMFKNCDNVKSFATGVNIDKEIIDNEHGDFIIADFNFDKLDDFAIALDYGGNGGTIYSFYLQKKNGKFELDQFLTNKMLRFPISFDEKNKTLTTSVHASMYENSETIYGLRGGKWKVIGEKILKL